MKEDSKPNPQYTNSNFSEDLEKSAMNAPGENSNQKKKGGESSEKRLEDKPGAYLLKETAEDENNESFEELEFNDDELNFNPFDDEDTQD